MWTAQLAFAMFNLFKKKVKKEKKQKRVSLAIVFF
jgi:hypothetical protein